MRGCLRLFLATVLAIAAAPIAGQVETASERDAAPGTASGLADEYAGSAVCAGCHSELHAAYAASAMGSSMSPADDRLRPLVESAVPVVSEVLNRRFVVEERFDGFYQRETEATPTDKPAFDSAHKLAYVIGSGVNGFSFLVRRAEFLVQAPVSYYMRESGWDLSPGYEFAKPGEDYGFNRTIHAACLQCHAGRPVPVDGGDGRYADPPFAELAIGCENCHGPGRRHVDARLADSESDVAAIVNPLRLPSRLAENICMNCHQGGDARVLQPGRDHFDFRPGEWLNETVAILKLPMDREDPRESDLLEHNASMALSRCFLGSGGELSCFSCHEIHNQPRPAERADYYRGKCLQCHTDSSCSRAPALRGSDNCADCHMPKRDIAEISHSSLTNHRVVRSPGQAFPPEAFEQTTPDLAQLVHVNRPPGAGAESLPLRVRFQAFGELSAKRPDLSEQYLRLLAEAAENIGDDPLVMAALGRRAKLEGRASEAIDYLTDAVAAGSRTASTYEDLAELLDQAGRGAEAAEVLARAVESSPLDPRLRKQLALRYINLKRYQEAHTTIGRFVELFPEDDLMRGLWRQVQGLPITR